MLAKRSNPPEAYVPTWNYAVAHVWGVVRLLEGFKDLIGILGKMTAKFEGPSPKPWRFSLPEDLKMEEQLTGAIVGKMGGKRGS